MRALHAEKEQREQAIAAAKAALAELAELRQWKELAARQLAAAQLQLEGRGASTEVCDESYVVWHPNMNPNLLNLTRT